MDAAINCFSREGFHRTTMQDIVAESGLSAGSLYRYFDSKESIVAAIAGEHHVPEATALAEAQDAPNATDGLRQIVRASLGRLSDPAEQRWRRVTIQLWSEALRDERVMDVVRAGLDGPIDDLARCRPGSIPTPRPGCALRSFRVWSCSRHGIPPSMSSPTSTPHLRSSTPWRGLR
jgi:AcrR family transcriptional regulator